MIINFPIANGNNSHNLNYHYIDTLWGLGKIQNPLLAFSSAELLEKAMEREINLWTAPTLPLLIIFAGPMVDFPLCSKLIILSSIFEIKKWQMGIPRFFGAISDEPLLRLILGDACWHCSSQVFFHRILDDDPSYGLNSWHGIKLPTSTFHKLRKCKYIF